MGQSISPSKLTEKCRFTPVRLCFLFVESLTELLWLPYAYWDQGFLGRPHLAIQMEWLDALIDKYTLLSSKIVGQLTRVLDLLNMGGSRGMTGDPDPLENHKKISGVLAMLVRIHWTTTKLSQYSNLGNYRHASETPVKWRFAGGSMMARLK